MLVIPFSSPQPSSHLYHQPVSFLSFWSQKASSVLCSEAMDAADLFRYVVTICAALLCKERVLGPLFSQAVGLFLLDFKGFYVF